MLASSLVPAGNASSAGTLSGFTGSVLVELGAVDNPRDSSGFESLQPAKGSETSSSDLEGVSEKSRARLFSACQNGVRAHMGYVLIVRYHRVQIVMIS